ncbi:MAG TPA: TetR family transcriptional regulator [Paenibacillus sp.]|nr:TetR family transcriptional regulator [Paenibacillus sp.]
MRKRILLAAKSLFADKGFEGASVREVCEAAGVNVALVSYHFGGKEKLFQALFDEFFPPAAALEPYRPLLDRPYEGLAFMIEQVMRTLVQERDMSAIIEQEILKRSPRLPFIQERVFPFWRFLRDLLNRGKAEGVFRFRSLDTTFFMVLGAILFHKRGFYFEPLMQEAPQRPEDVIADTIAFVYGGLGAAPPEGGRIE